MEKIVEIYGENHLFQLYLRNKKLSRRHTFLPKMLLKWPSLRGQLKSKIWTTLQTILLENILRVILIFCSFRVAVGKIWNMSYSEMLLNLTVFAAMVPENIQSKTVHEDVHFILQFDVVFNKTPVLPWRQGVYVILRLLETTLSALKGLNLSKQIIWTKTRTDSLKIDFILSVEAQ